MNPEIQDTLTQTRRDIIRMVYNVQSGHIGGSLGCVELFYALYHEVMDYSPSFSMSGAGEDMFFLSNGHISPVWYSTMARRGLIPVAELGTFRKLNTRLQGHPTTAEHLEGVRIASGSLGQGLSVAAGVALAKKMNNDPHKVFVLMGDGELQEGQIWEAALFGAHHQLGNLIGIVDCNGKQIDGDVENVLNINVLKDKWSSFGWEVLACDGNDYEELKNTLRQAKEKTTDKPQMLLMKTKMGKGVDFMEDSHKWHGTPPTKEQMEAALAQLSSSLTDF